MLVEMDGFDVNRGVILIAATNRPDILDPALLRPGRFDRQIVVDRPDLEGRKAILGVHAKGKPFADAVDLAVIARRTPGFTGADLANVINEAALLTARNDTKQITTVTLEEAIDRVTAGPMRKTRVMSEKEKKVTAYHEGGHALVAWALPNTDPVHKISIVARGRSLGHTLVLPEEDKYNQTRSEMMDMLAYALGGRAAEELVFHEPTTGASNDIEKATSTAKAMVMTYGMSEKLGALKFGRHEGDVFLGRDLGHERDFSEDVARQIDDEVRALIETAHDEAWDILVEYRDVLDDMVLKLLDKETLTKADLTEIFATVDKRPHRIISAARRPPTDRKPVLTAAELALMGPQDVADLGNGNGNGNGRAKANGSKSTAANGGRKTTARSRATKASPAQRTTKRTEGRGRAPGTT
jgi:cell division protease FtsH